MFQTSQLFRPRLDLAHRVSAVFCRPCGYGASALTCLSQAAPFFPFVREVLRALLLVMVLCLLVAHPYCDTDSQRSPQGGGVSVCRLVQLLTFSNRCMIPFRPYLWEGLVVAFHCSPLCRLGLLQACWVHHFYALCGTSLGCHALLVRL